MSEIEFAPGLDFTQPAVIPNTFGRDYRRALFMLGAPLAATRVAVVLIDHAHAKGSTSIEVSYRTLRRETFMDDGRSIDQGRDWLVEHGLTVVKANGLLGRAARTTWTLTIPGQVMTALQRTFQHPKNDRSTADISQSKNDRGNDRNNDRSTADTYPGPIPKNQEHVEKQRPRARVDDCPLDAGCLLRDTYSGKPATGEQLLEHLMSIHGLLEYEAEQLIAEAEAA